MRRVWHGDGRILRRRIGAPCVTRLAYWIGKCASGRSNTALLLCLGAVVLQATSARASSDSAPPPPKNDPVLERQLLEEAPKAWMRLDDFYRNVRMITHQSSSASHAKQPPQAVVNEIAVLGDSIREITRRVDGEGAETVQAKNELYAFALSRRGNSPESLYAIQWLEKLGASDAIDKKVARLETVVRGTIVCPWRIAGKSILDWTRTSGFHLKSVMSAGSSGSGLVRADFEHMPFDPDSVDANDVSGFAIFDPGRYWVMREAGVEFGTGILRVCAFEYREGRGGMPVVTKLTVRDYAKPHNLYEERETTVEKTSFGEVSSKEFRLSAFGMPEPVFGSLRSRLHLWPYVSAGIACLLAAYILHRRRARLDASHVP
jgi:hypothetical protein